MLESLKLLYEIVSLHFLTGPLLLFVIHVAGERNMSDNRNSNTRTAHRWNLPVLGLVDSTVLYNPPDEKLANPNIVRTARDYGAENAFGLSCGI